METVDEHIYAPSWVFGDLGRMAESMGARPGELLLVGLVYSITTLEHKEWDLGNILGRFSNEVKEMKVRVSDRCLDINVMREKFGVRERLTAEAEAAKSEVLRSLDNKSENTLHNA